MYNHILLDSDILINKICFAGQTVCYSVYLTEQEQVIDTFKSKKEAMEAAAKIDDPVEVIRNVDTLPLPVMKKMMDELVMSILDTLNCHTYTMYIGPVSGTQTYRHEIAVTAPYKGNRKKEDRPLYIQEMQEYLIAKYTAIRAPIGETDDMLGLDQCSSNGTSVIVSIDKDLLMIPGWHYNIDKKKLQFVSDPGTLSLDLTNSGTKKLTGTGFIWFLAQLLLGDATDNIIKPKPKFGDVKIYDYLTSDPGCTILSLWNKIEKIYKEENRDIVENATLLWVSREQGKNWLEVLDELKEVTVCQSLQAP